MSLTVDTSSTMENVLVKLQRYKTYHFLFWILYAAFWSFTFVPGNNLFSAFGTSLLILLFHAVVAYFNNYYLIEKYLLKREYGTYLLSLLLSIALAFFPIVLIYYVVVLEDSSASQQVWSWRFFLINSFSIGLTVAITTSLKLLKDYYQKERRNKELLKLNNVSELKFLKGQINPHFLFNSLNNLYALSLKKSDSTPDFILKLSGLLRYVLYDSSEGKVGIDKEVEYLENYIDLERIRLSDRGVIELHKKGFFTGKLIEPMLMIPFVENAIKHGINSIANGAWVKINLTLEDGVLHFTIENNKPKAENLPLKNQPGGIGIENTKRRLSILYPNSHELSIRENESTYFVSLKVKL
jgi:sensor histidine kinase YesM